MRPTISSRSETALEQHDTYTQEEKNKIKKEAKGQQQAKSKGAVPINRKTQEGSKRTTASKEQGGSAY
jgi:hypothetical protein